MMFDPPPIDIFSVSFLIASVVTVTAGFMRGFLGVGSGMLMAPVFAIIFGPRNTVAMIIMMDLIVTAQMLPSVYKKIQWLLSPLCSCPSVAGCW